VCRSRPLTNTGDLLSFGGGVAKEALMTDDGGSERNGGYDLYFGADGDWEDACGDWHGAEDGR
ncbi:MAG: hypothetical protein KAH23_01040, partial [Kiritimatiellae bacterium]|nr:hypothetical protein [Kiritimatiellia bacterium]